MSLSTAWKARHARHAAVKLAMAQRANKKKRVRALHAKVTNARKDYLHKHSARLVRQYDYIVVGNVSACKLAKTNLAKSVLDTGWSSFRNMPKYKAIAHGAWFEEIDEKGTTRVCSSCASETGPKGVADLGKRQWECSDCGAVHDRDQNAALNILVARSGHRTPVVGILAL